LRKAKTHAKTFKLSHHNRGLRYASPSAEKLRAFSALVDRLEEPSIFQFLIANIFSSKFKTFLIDHPQLTTLNC